MGWAPGPGSARYGYSVWLRHLSAIAGAGLPTDFATVVEAGPGPSMAAGAAALLTGAERYVAVDAVPHLLQPGAGDRLHAQFETVRGLLADRAPIPAADFPELRPALDCYDFPDAVLPDARLNAALAPARVDALRPPRAPQVVAAPDGGQVVDFGAFRYVCPWTATAVHAASADLVFSQAVLQEIPHAGDGPGSLAASLRAMAAWLRPGGVMSHQVDLGSYGGGVWNEHWTFGDLTWRVVRGRRVNYVNREPLSTYLELLAACGMRVAALVSEYERGAPPESLAPRFQALPAEERDTRSAHVVAVRDA